jgi:hypothetical protein
VIRVYDETGKVIETHGHGGDSKQSSVKRVKGTDSQRLRGPGPTGTYPPGGHDRANDSDGRRAREPDEGLYGFKEEKSGADGDAFRIQIGAVYSIFD